jgi:hypothetical protein
MSTWVNVTAQWSQLKQLILCLFALWPIIGKISPGRKDDYGLKSGASEVRLMLPISTAQHRLVPYVPLVTDGRRLLRKFVAFLNCKAWAVCTFNNESKCSYNVTRNLLSSVVTSFSLKHHAVPSGYLSFLAIQPLGFKKDWFQIRTWLWRIHL